METRYEWDAEKAKANERKHGVSFETATEVFDDPHHLVIGNVSTEDEEREQAIGMTKGLLLAAVIFVDRSEPGAEVIRIISARKADRYEESLYKDQQG